MKQTPGWQPATVSGRHVPLFERFDEELDDLRVMEPYSVQGRTLLAASIQRQIELMLNTRLAPRRAPATGWEATSEPQTVIDYGLPALSSLSAASLTDAALLRKTVLAKIAAFEPRLEKAELDLRPDPDDPAALLGTLRGQVTLERIHQPVCFPIHLRGDAAKVSPADALRE